MSDSETVETNDEQQEQATGKGLRAQLEASLAREAELKARILSGAYDELGLDPSTGLGKAIAKEYTGEASPEALAEYAAKEYGYTPPVQADNPLAGQIASEQARLDQVGETAGSVAPPSRDEVLAKAEAEGDYQTTMAIKGAEVASWLGGGRR